MRRGGVARLDRNGSTKTKQKQQNPELNIYCNWEPILKTSHAQAVLAYVSSAIEINGNTLHERLKQAHGK